MIENTSTPNYGCPGSCPNPMLPGYSYSYGSAPGTAPYSGLGQTFDPYGSYGSCPGCGPGCGSGCGPGNYPGSPGYCPGSCPGLGFGKGAANDTVQSGSCGGFGNGFAILFLVILILLLCPGFFGGELCY